MEFTEAQLAAIKHTEGNLHLIACAGSGKTEVVARRIAKLLASGTTTRIGPANIVAFTFTDKAAAELKERIVTRCREELGELIGMADMYVGTIHAFCLELLKTEVPVYLKYGVLNDVQQALLVDRNSQQSGLTTSTDLQGTRLRRFVDTQRYIEALSILREARTVPERMAAVSVKTGLQKYKDLLGSKRYLDYSAIMEEAVNAILNDKGLQTRIRERIRHVVLDEYQDVNPIQERLVNILHSLGANICVVGDDDQTVYQWRGSEVRNILTFAERYPNVQTIRLQENFRSSRGIVETARDFIKQNSERLEKAMEPTDAQAFEPGDLVALSFDAPETEARFIADTIQQLRGIAFHDGGEVRGLSYSDCAILLRSVRTNGEPIIDALRAAGVPAIVVGMNNLFGTDEAIAARGIFYFVSDAGVDRAGLRHLWLSASLGVTAAAVDGAIDALECAKKELHESDQKRWGLYSLQRIFRDFLAAARLREETVPNGIDGSTRGEIVFYNLGKFSQVISDFEEIHFHSDPETKYQAFSEFLRHQASDAYPEGWQDNQYANPDAVRIMTVHQAKGMQWPAVFVPALLRNRFPAAAMGGKSVWHLLPSDGVVGQLRFVGNIEDERRLFYVALTRSQKFLFMTWAPVAGKNNRYVRASEFWNDVLASKWVKRRVPDYSVRPRATPQPRAGLSNVVLTFSDIKYFFECPYQFKLRILYGFNPPIHEALGYGKSLHDALSEVHSNALRGQMAEVADADRLVNTHLHVPYAYKALRETLEKSAKHVIAGYIEKNRSTFPNLEFSEKAIELHLDDGVSVVGRIDLVRKLDTNEVSIVDLKTSDRCQAEEVTETQLHIYALGYQELTGRRADYVDIYELDEQKRKPRSVDDELIADVKQKIGTAANALRKSLLPARPSVSVCKSCDFRKLCSGCIATGSN
jgi:DNA helicase-2/ATP-dependent DNA helicase PcrA